MKQKIIITMGDPSGIGPEVAVKALANRKISRLADFFVIGDRAVIEKACRDTGVGLGRGIGIIDLANVLMKDFSYGRRNPRYGRASIGYIDRALGIISSGKTAALVTAPINKSSIISSGMTGFQGHTEYLAEKTGSVGAAMMFVGKKLKITLVTRHIALRSVPRRISVDSVFNTIMTTHSHLLGYFGIKHPRIGVAGLNPHAGESGVFGKEEEHIIAPAVKAASKKIKGVSGPVPPDVIFYDAYKGRYDAVIALYHDQGLIPFKLLYFRDGVNLTLGLPFVRTSPDHGTAFDIAGKGVADPTSMEEAIFLAHRLLLKKTKC